MISGGRSLGPDDLVASYFTLSGAGVGQAPRFSLAERIVAAGNAGFPGIGIQASDYETARASGLSDADLRTLLDDHGVSISELEFLIGWAGDDSRGARTRAEEDRLYAVADALGGRHLVVTELAAPGELPPLDQVAERFAGICDRAAEHGLLVVLEFLPWAAIGDASAAGQIVARADRANGGVLVDSWHYFRGAADPVALRAIGSKGILAVQLDDGGGRSGNLMADTLDRRLPGDGDFALEGFIGLLDEIGVRAPICVEIISSEHHARPLDRAARVAHDSTRALLQRARSAT